MDEPPTEIDIGEVTADNLDDLLARAEQGEEILIIRDGHPVVSLRPAPPRRRREPGVWRGQVVIHDDFEELPEDLAEPFERREQGTYHY